MQTFRLVPDIRKEGGEMITYIAVGMVVSYAIGMYVGRHFDDFTKDI